MLIAVDTGGTKTLVAAFSEQGKLTASHKFPTPKDQTEYLKSVEASVRQVADKEKIDAIVLALPGVIKNGVALWCKNLGWTDFPAKNLIESIFPGVPVLVENDANLAGLGETRMQATVPNSSLYVTFSTGVGTSVVSGGRLNKEFRLSEGGLSTIEYNGQFDLWEHISSGRRLHEVYGKYASEIDDDDIWRDVADRMSRGLLVLIPFMQPELVIIGGSLGSYFERYGHHLKDIINDRLFEAFSRPQIISASHPEEAVVYGCYYHAVDELAEQSAQN